MEKNWKEMVGEFDQIKPYLNIAEDDDVGGDDF